MEPIETSTFTRQITALLSDETYGEFQSRLAANPQLGPLIKRGGGIRKTRVAVGSRGKRGGARVIYYWAESTLDRVALRLLKERGDRSDTETGFATRQSGQGRVRQ